MRRPIPERFAAELKLEAPEDSHRLPVVNPTDLGNAQRLVARHGQDLRYVHDWSRWLVWDGKRWRPDNTGEVVRRAEETVRAMYHQADPGDGGPVDKELAKHAMRSESRGRIEAMIALAESRIPVPVPPDELDGDPWLLNVTNGTLDLKTWELRDHRREDLITKLAPVEFDRDAQAPTFQRFLKRVLPPEELRRFVQRAIGYSLTGDTRERILLILHGVGRNGKSTLLEVMREVLGDYAMKTPAETLMAKPTGGIPNDLARLKGARFVSASETEQNRRLAESLVKEITGNDTISARFMRAEWFDFRPSHKTWLATNHRPEIRGTDPAIWDRIRLIPFEVRIPDEEIDRALPEKLRAELPGVLAWAVKGCIEWQREGLGEPEKIRVATEGYRADMDVLAGFLDDRCSIGPNAWAKATPLYEAYKAWCEETGERAETQRRFGMRLTERGFVREKVGGTYRWYGIGLRSDGPDGPDGPDDPGDGPSNGLGRESPAKNMGKSDQVMTNKTFMTESRDNGSPNSLREVNRNLGPDGPKGPTLSVTDVARREGGPAKPRPLTTDEVQRIRTLVQQGMAPAKARAEVLGEEIAGGG
jgi:putative DNA primase/helicase